MGRDVSTLVFSGKETKLLFLENQIFVYKLKQQSSLLFCSGLFDLSMETVHAF